MWNTSTWAAQLFLWLATIVNDRGWRLLAALGSVAVAVQAFIGLESAWIGLRDGRISQMGAVVGVLSAGQIGLTVLWILLIWRLKRTV